MNAGAYEPYSWAGSPAKAWVHTAALVNDGMGHPSVELAAHGVREVRVVVAVAGRPPGGDAVDQLAPVVEHDACAVGARDRERRGRGFHLGVGQPDVGAPGLVPVGSRHIPTVVMPSFCSRTRSWSASGFGVVRSLGP